MRKIFVELRCLHLLQLSDGLLPNFKEIVLIDTHRLKYFINQLGVELLQLIDGFNLANYIFLLKQLKQPVVLFLDDLNLSNKFHVRINSDPENWRLEILDIENVLSSIRIFFQLKIV